jgi:hypothetical protein
VLSYILLLFNVRFMIKSLRPFLSIVVTHNNTHKDIKKNTKPYRMIFTDIIVFQYVYRLITRVMHIHSFTKELYAHTNNP